MSIALVTSTIKNTGTNGGTTDAVNTTGADLLILAVSQYTLGGAISVSDSKGNTWTPLTGASASDAQIRLYYAKNPTVGSGHTFTATGSGVYITIGLLAVSGAHLVTPFDQENGAATEGATSRNTGSVTPSENNEILIAAVSTAGAQGADISVNGGFTLQHFFNYDGSTMGLGLAYLIQTTATAANPSFSWTNSIKAAAAIATFKEFAPDVTPPTISSWAVAPDGLSITGTLSESGCVPTSWSGANGFTIGSSSRPRTVSSGTISGTTITLALNAQIGDGWTITVSYSGGNVEDSSGNDLATITNAAVTNNSTVDYIYIPAATTETLTEDRPVGGSSTLVVEGANPTTSILDGDGFKITGTVTGLFRLYNFKAQNLGVADDGALDITHGSGGKTEIEEVIFDACDNLRFQLGGNGYVRLDDVTVNSNALYTVGSNPATCKGAMTIDGTSGAANHIDDCLFQKGYLEFGSNNNTGASEWRINRTIVVGPRGGIGVNDSCTNVACDECFCLSSHDTPWSQVSCISGKLHATNSIFMFANWVVSGPTGSFTDCAILVAAGHEWVVQPKCTFTRNIFALDGNSYIEDDPEAIIDGIDIFDPGGGANFGAIFDHNTFLNAGTKCFRIRADTDVIIKSNLFWNWDGGVNIYVIGPADDEPVSGTPPRPASNADRLGYANYNAFGFKSGTGTTDPYAVGVTGSTYPDSNFGDNDILETGDPTFGITGFTSLPFDPADIIDGSTTVAAELANIRLLCQPPFGSVLTDAGLDNVTIGAVEAAEVVLAGGCPMAGGMHVLAGGIA